MANSRYQTRANYERLYYYLVDNSSSPEAISLKPEELSDKDLLKTINYFLIFSGCIPMTKKELSQQLN